jgi:hypothetical protein
VTLLLYFSFFSAVNSPPSRDDDFLLSLSFFFVFIPHLFVPFKSGPPLFVYSTLGLQISLFFFVSVADSLLLL